MVEKGTRSTIITSNQIEISSDESDCESSTTFGHNGYVEYDPYDYLEIQEEYTGNEEMVDNEQMAEDTLAEQNNNEGNTPKENTVPINATPMQQSEENHDNLALNKKEKKIEEEKVILNYGKPAREKKKETKVEYVGATGKIRLPRFPKNIGQSCDCTFKCHLKINDDMKSAIFRAFWDLGSVEKQRGFIIKHVQRSAVKRTRTDNSRRGFSQKYILVLNSCSLVPKRFKERIFGTHSK